MAHKTLIGGTAYNVAGGKSMIGGTTYNIKSGRTLIGGTGYDIKFIGDVHSMLYSDGAMVFQYGDDVESGKTLSSSYKGFINAQHSTPASVKWNAVRGSIKTVTFKEEIFPVDIRYWFNGCTNLTSFNHANLNTSALTNMYYAFDNCNNMVSTPICSNKIVSMQNAYSGCHKLTGSPVCGSKVTSMYATYYNCQNITGNPVCGANVTTLGGTYTRCYKLTGNPVCGNKVTSMYGTYNNCYNITGSPVCGANVTIFSAAYTNCRKLTGSPVCGNKVTAMVSTYRNCINLTGAPACGSAVTNMYCAYHTCTNLSGNAYFYSPNVSNMTFCFASKNKSKRLNLYIKNGSTTLNSALWTNSNSMVASAVTWTHNASNNCYYNATWNLYIYAVDDVAAACTANGD